MMFGLSRYRTQAIAIFALALAVWLVSGVALHRYTTDYYNSLRVQDASRNLVHRVEMAIDFVVIANTELLIAGHTNCSAQTVGLLRRLVLETGTASDIFLITDTGTCSTFNSDSVLLPAAAERSQWAEARNSDFRIGRIPGRTSSMMGVSWGFGTEFELVASISADAILFDILPQDLRSSGRVYLSANDTPIAQFTGDTARGIVDATWLSFAASGERYPVNVDIRLDTETWAEWRRNMPLPLVFLWSFFGVLAAVLAAYVSMHGRNKALEQVLQAIKQDEIVPHFQPIIDLRTGTVSGCEALARWQKPDGTLVSPGYFIPMIEQYGLDDRLLSRLVTGAANSFHHELDERPDFYISFNVTPGQLSRPGFADFLISLTQQNHMKPQQICVEITERQIIAAPKEAAKTTTKLSEAGFGVAIDDAGTGHNGLASIQSLDIETIKIDKFFVDHIVEEARSRVMVDMFVSVARRYGMRTVAEGVETQAQLKALKLAGVDAVQGFLYSEPLPANEFLFSLHTKWESFATEIDVRADDKEAVIAIEPAAMTPAMQQYANDEVERLDALHRYQILDTEPEEGFDRIPRIIRSALNAPMAAIALIDEDRRWFKAVDGGKRGEINRQDSFCNHTIMQSAPTVVPDTRMDSRFQNNVLVVNEPHIRAYLGVPLETPDGYRIGSVCCVDKEPRSFTDDEVRLVKDLSSIVIEQLELRKLALFDPLTGIWSRRGFRAETETRLAIAQSQKRTSSLLMLDIDHFKQINDTYGHAVGDDVLVGLCDRLNLIVEDTEVFGRLGGEEFAIALPGQNLSDAVILAERIRKDVAHSPFRTSAGEVSLSVSIGVACSNGFDYELDAMLEQADYALYQAKGNGRDCISSYDPKAA